MRNELTSQDQGMWRTQDTGRGGESAYELDGVLAGLLRGLDGVVGVTEQFATGLAVVWEACQPAGNSEHPCGLWSQRWESVGRDGLAEAISQ